MKSRFTPAAKRKLTYTELRELIHYDPETGTVLWCGPNSSRRKKGAIVGAIFDGRGHLGCVINLERHYLHRLIWLWMTGEWPIADLDHIDGDFTNNRWCNLRQATRAENLANRRVTSRSQTGLKGVCLDKRDGAWFSSVTVKGVVHYLGRFESAEAAHDAYAKAAKRLHGEFARS